ncbi:DUF4255 domain-containing protein [Cellvibrio sp. KY-GH-1]|uniref:DUF4255 domain-containing protein n=1 Tax=Cellvibrio sp. KY-GH-1 TaxID=2303332 RepID=UPI001243EF4F|nr:DUF4255 domain-containing protein [Cellvibrio sp. KY-GH-1]QEY17589.1 DUF4255 domain-containing protein [Cellvibrio sp. KY-GH-1]
MIQAAINHLAVQLNAYLKRTNNLTEDIVVVSSLVESDGNVAANTNNKLVLFLTNIEKDPVPQANAVRATGFDGRALVGSRSLYLNLYVMLAANFSGSNYPEALKFISKAIAFFQMQPVFDKQSTPDLDSRIDKLVLDIENLNIQDLSNLWGLLGGKYLPSVYYRVRMVSINPDNVIAQLPYATRPQSDVRG